MPKSAEREKQVGDLIRKVNHVWGFVCFLGKSNYHQESKIIILLPKGSHLRIRRKAQRHLRIPCWRAPCAKGTLLFQLKPQGCLLCREPPPAPSTSPGPRTLPPSWNGAPDSSEVRLGVHMRSSDFTKSAPRTRPSLPPGSLPRRAGLALPRSDK